MGGRFFFCEFVYTCMSGGRFGGGILLRVPYNRRIEFYSAIRDL